MKFETRYSTAPRLSALAALFLVGCVPPTGELFPKLRISAQDDGEAIGSFLDVFDGADRTLRVALPALGDASLSEHLIDAANRGVEVEVIADVDHEQEFSAVVDAGIPIQFADGAVTFFDFNSTVDVSWGSKDATMSHAFALADGYKYVSATNVGSAGGTRVVFEGQGEDLVEDLTHEFVQIFGGTDATAMTAFSNSSKSIADHRWRYGSDTDVDLEVWLSPQERVGKRVVDAAYSARHSIRVLTNDFANEGLALALEEKAADGFDVQVIVGPNFGDSSSPLSRLLQNDTPNVDKRSVNASGPVPTIVLIDADDSYADSASRGMVLSFDLLSTGRLYRGEPVKTDQYTDGSLWVVNDWGARSEALEPILDVYAEYLDISEAL